MSYAQQGLGWTVAKETCEADGGTWLPMIFPSDPCRYPPQEGGGGPGGGTTRPAGVGGGSSSAYLVGGALVIGAIWLLSK